MLILVSKNWNCVIVGVKKTHKLNKGKWTYAISVKKQYKTNKIKLVATTGRDTFNLMEDKTIQGFLYLRESENYYCDAVDAFVSLNWQYEQLRCFLMLNECV